MLRLRRSVLVVVSGVTAMRTDGVAEAGAGVILSAICAMKVPRPIMIAAKIIMLRITPLSTAVFQFAAPTDFITNGVDLTFVTHRAGGNFGQKDERRVNELITFPLV
jgi:hypothetical protein